MIEIGLVLAVVGILSRKYILETIFTVVSICHEESTRVQLEKLGSGMDIT